MDASNWQRNLNKSQKQMDGFGKSVKTISNGVKAAWVSIASIGISQVFDGIVELTKAAAEDNKSMALLNEQMKRTWHGNEALNKSIDAQIDNMSNLTGIADDKLRPALIRIAAVTKTPAKGMKYLGLATDIAAKSGQDLNLVSRNMAKFLGGNKTALDKLVPGLSNSGNRMAFLIKNYQGFAAIAGSNDPFSRITVVMDNFKEKLGKSFLPVVQKFSDWLASPDAQKSLDELAAKVQEFGDWFASKEGQETFKGWMEDLKAMIKLAAQFLGIAGKVAELLTSSGANPLKNKKVTPTNISTGTNIPLVSKDEKSGWTSLGKQIQTIVINATVPNANGKDVVTALQAYARGKGIPMSKLLK